MIKRLVKYLQTYLEHNEGLKKWAGMGLIGATLLGSPVVLPSCSKDKMEVPSPTEETSVITTYPDENGNMKGELVGNTI